MHNNIDEQIIDSPEIDEQKEQEDEDINLEDIVINNYHNDLALKNGCSGCNISREKISEEFLKGTFIEATSKGLIGDHFAKLDDEDKSEYIKGDKIIVRCEDNSEEISTITEVGKIVTFKKSKCDNDVSVPVVLRVANEKDLDQYKRNLLDEQKAKPIFEKAVVKYDLNMKLVDLHYQFDRKKLYFFYTSDGRVDFRELAKELASNFRTRIELRQIGVRDEAKRIGGVGACGREFCCSTFLSNFQRITTQIASDQNLSTNLSKLSGPCGKLKCCLSFEHDKDNIVIEDSQIKVVSESE